MALLTLLGGLVEPAELIVIFASLTADALALQGTEDIIRTIVLFELPLLLFQLAQLYRMCIRGRIAGLPCGCDQTRLSATGRVVSKDAILDRPNPEEVELLVNIVADWHWKIGLPVVHYRLLAEPPCLKNWMQV